MKLFVSFFSVSAALYAQKCVNERGFACEVVPVPRSISSSCGYALETVGVSGSDLPGVLNEAKVEWEAIYLQTTNDNSGHYQRIATRTEENEHDK